MTRFNSFEADEIRYMLELFGDQHRDSGAAALWDEAAKEIEGRALAGDREAEEVFYNSPIPFPKETT